MNSTGHYDEMKDSGIQWIGIVPAHWNVRTLYQLVTRVNNKNSDLAEQNLLSLSYGKIKRKDINTNDGLLPASFDGYNVIESGDIVLRLTDLQNDRTSLRVGHATERGIITSAYTTLRPINSAHSRYLYYLIHAFDIKKGFYGMGSGVRQGLNYSEVKELRIAIPPQAEMNAIVAFLDDKCVKIDELIESVNTTIEEYKSWKMSLIFKATTMGNNSDAEMVKSTIPWIERHPSHWHTLPMKRVILSRDSGAWGNESNGDVNDKVCMRISDFAFEQGRFKESVDLFTVRNYNQSTIDKLSLKYGDILVEKSGGGEKTPVGRAVMFNLPIDALFANFMDRLKIDSNIVTPEFFEYYWRGMYFRSVTSAYIKQTIGFQNLNLAGLLNSEFVLVPPKDEQCAIVSYLDDLGTQIDTLVENKKNLLSELEIYKRSLIYEAVTGKRKVV
ncbi:MAG: restriction endonuclease subunit S [Clostridia bacterium]|nr:restriction endonuclease subunit S [Clostridia bacterium]